MQYVGSFVVHGEKEVQMDAELRQVLEEESVCAHKLSVSNLMSSDICCVVNAESVKHSGKEHILSNEGKLAVSLHIRLSVVKIVVDFAETNHGKYWVALHKDDED